MAAFLSLFLQDDDKINTNIDIVSVIVLIFSLGLFNKIFQPRVFSTFRFDSMLSPISIQNLVLRKIQADEIEVQGNQ